MSQQRYHVIEKIDAGGMAEVFKANVSSIKGYEKLVAIKRILPDLTKDERFVRMFLDEAKVSLRLSHTNCVQVFDLGQADRTYFIVMEYVDGVNLKFVIDKYQQNQKRIKIEHAAYIAIEVCKGLAHAHEKRDQDGNHLGIVHRDVSPPNVLVSREGEVKLTDFGLAKAKDQIEQTDPGVVKGKFGYLSPEAALGDDVDHRTDIFALGILLWEMLAGVRLFRGRTDLDTLKQVRKNKYRPLSEFRTDVPPPLEQIIRKLLNGVDGRYQTIREAVNDLSAFLFGYGVPVTSFDIAAMVAQVGGRHKTTAGKIKDRAIEEAVQQAVNRIVSLEEIEDLDSHMAENYGSLPDAGQKLSGNGSEDPRLWADVGFEDISLKPDAGNISDSGTWSKRNVNDLAHRNSSQVPVVDHQVTGPLPRQSGQVPEQMYEEDYEPTEHIQIGEIKNGRISPPTPVAVMDSDSTNEVPYLNQASQDEIPYLRQADEIPYLTHGTSRDPNGTGLPPSMGPTPSVSAPRNSSDPGAAFGEGVVFNGGEQKKVSKKSGLPIGVIFAVFVLIISLLGMGYVLFFR